MRSRFVGDSAIDQWPHSSEHKTISDLINGPKDLSANISTFIDIGFHITVEKPKPKQ